MTPYQTFVRQMRQIERDARKDRVRARGENRTLDLGPLATSINRKKELVLTEYGKDVRYTVAQLKQFDSRRKAVERQFGSTGTTILAILAQMRPFPTFAYNSDKVSSDLARARNIPRPEFVSARGNTLNFRVRAENPDPKRGLSHHLTSVKLVDLEKALRTPLDDKGTYIPAVQNAIKGGVKVNCDCGRYRYWYSYKATVGGYAIKEERGFPKIRNRRLTGTVCKHLIVTLTYLKNSRPLHRNLADRFAKLANLTFPDKASEVFVNQKEEQRLRKSRLDRKLRGASTAKKTFKREKAAKKREERRLVRIATKIEKRQEIKDRKKQREEERKAKFEQLQQAQSALQRQLEKETKERQKLERKLAKQQQDTDREVVTQVVRALRQAGLDDATIRENPVVKKSKIPLEEIK